MLRCTIGSPSKVAVSGVGCFGQAATDRGEPPNMSIEAHLAELQRRHRALEEQINEARSHPSVDDLQIVELKRRKLLVKDEIARLQKQNLLH
jgi:hypothetical protein